MTFIATTRVNVRRPVAGSKDALGYAKGDPGEVVIPDIPFGLVEKTREVWLPETQELRTVRKHTGRAEPRHDIRRGDIIEDLADGRRYAVDERTLPTKGLAGHRRLTLELRYVGDA